jgi:hypothetical protein
VHAIADDLRGHGWYLDLVWELLDELEAYLGRLATLEDALAAVGD